MICQLASVGASAETTETVDDKETLSSEDTAKEIEAEKQEETESLSSVQSVSEEFKSKSIEEYEEIVSKLSVEKDPLSDNLVLDFSAEEQYALERVIDSYKEADESDTDEVLVSESPYSYNSTYYYSQLKTDDEKKFYTDLKAAMDNILYSTDDLSGTLTEYGMLMVDYVPVSSTISTARANAIFRALYYENPQYYFIYGCYGYNDSSSLSSYAVGIIPECAAYSERAYLQSEIDEFALSVIEGSSKYTNDADKEAYIAEMICTSVEYNDAAVENGTANKTNQSIVGAFVNKTCVCNGYAMASAYLLNAVGINTIGVTSDGYQGETDSDTIAPHAWNNVYVDGTWYVLDTTWMNTDNYLTEGIEDVNFTNFNKSYATLQNESFYSKVCHTNAAVWDNFSMPECTKDFMTAPDAPTGLSAISGRNSAYLSWTASPTAEWYELHYSYGDDSKFFDYIYTNEAAVFEIDSSYDCVYFWVKACNRGGRSTYSEQLTVPIYGPDDIIPPQGLTAYGGFDSISLVWNQNDDVDGFKVYWIDDEGYAELWADTADNYIRFEGLDCGRTYTFYVRSYKGSDISDWSLSATAQPISENTVTVSDVDKMWIFDCIDWVNSFEESLDNNNVLTAPQLYAIERVLDCDYYYDEVEEAVN